MVTFKFDCLNDYLSLFQVRCTTRTWKKKQVGSISHSLEVSLVFIQFLTCHHKIRGKSHLLVLRCRVSCTAKHKGNKKILLALPQSWPRFFLTQIKNHNILPLSLSHVSASSLHWAITNLQHSINDGALRFELDSPIGELSSFYPLIWASIQCLLTLAYGLARRTRLTVGCSVLMWPANTGIYPVILPKDKIIGTLPIFSGLCDWLTQAYCI